MHQNHDISSQTEIYYQSTINIEALKNARPTRRKNIVWRGNVKDNKKRKISSWWLASGFINKKLHHIVAGRSYSSEKTPKLTLIFDDIDTLRFREFDS